MAVVVDEGGVSLTRPALVVAGGLMLGHGGSLALLVQSERNHTVVDNALTGVLLLGLAAGLAVHFGRGLLRVDVEIYASAPRGAAIFFAGLGALSALASVMTNFGAAVFFLGLSAGAPALVALVGKDARAPVVAAGTLAQVLVVIAAQTVDVNAMPAAGFIASVLALDLGFAFVLVATRSGWSHGD